jgi:hypothetical protein
VPADLRTCPVCATPMPDAARTQYCSPACKTAAWRRANPNRPAGPPRARTVRPPTTGPLPAALRDCPHCGEPITIVALLTTPQVAGPQQSTGTPDTVPLHAIRPT